VEEDGQELQLYWRNNNKEEEDYKASCYYYGNVECLYNECHDNNDDDDIAIVKSSSSESSVVTRATTISTCDSSSSLVTTSLSSSSSRLSFSSSSSVSSSSSLQHDTDSLDLLHVDDQFYKSEQQQQQEKEDVYYKQQDNNNNPNLSHLCPVTGHYSNIHDHYYLPPSSSSSITLGTGQYGTVQNCIHIPSGQTYAVKTIPKSRMTHCYNHLRREIHILSKVATNHPNILQLVDFHEDETHVHIVTERYTGGELFDVIAEHSTTTSGNAGGGGGCLSERYAASIIKSVLEAVDYLHSMGIVHRDVKPENILFETKRDDDDNDDHYFASTNSIPIRLIDFGLSTELNDGEYLTDPVGTSYYMAPEVLMGKKYNQSCDIWSVGIITYILLCGYPPFNGGNDSDIKQMIMLHGHPDNVNFKLRGWDGKSEEVKDFIKCLLRRDPKKRFTTREALMHPWLKMYC
jgi:tRNA A-37 threonylcarbamoyl transferase component Bud32